MRLITRRDLFFWALALIALGLVSYATYDGMRGQMLVVGWIVVAGFVGAPMWLLWQRWRVERNWVGNYISGGYMFRVYMEGGIKPWREFAIDLMDATWPTFQAWREVPGIEGDLIPPVTTLVFRPLPFELHRKPGRFSGYVIPSSRVIIVGIDAENPRAAVGGLNAPALGHELGHLILDCHGLDPSEESLRRYHEEYGVPY